ncbi:MULTISPECIES: vWA domain-containing protein [Halorussus]|uniref:vWA domain-containing protein n=1 Tax=Halorussus TaxID=1070314 RepID=UPI00209DE1AA|nr:BatA and WFA domain-containing protein [Halorussus vallis]USZ73918.1 BatA and WFA domain-containing protein [Halorussus vallis]
MSAVDALGAALSSAFLRPLGLAAVAAAIPVLVLYLLKPNPSRVAFPAVEFLLGDREESRRHPALRRLRRNALLALQLLAIVAFAVSLASPYVPVSERRTVEETVLVVDRSASMATETGGATRFDRAVSAARKAVTTETSVVVAGATASVRAKRVPAAEAKATLDALAVAETDGTLRDAVRRATQIAGEDARIVVLSDFADEGWRSAVAAARARGHDVRTRQFAGGGADNVGAIDYSFADGNVSVRVKNFGDGRAKRRVSFAGETRSLTLGPGDVARETFAIPAGGGRLRLTPGDSFPVDDELAVAAPDDPTTNVLVLTNGENRPLVTALSVVRGTRVTVKRPPTSVSKDYDVVVFGDVAPGRLLDGTRRVAHETLARGGAVVIQARPNLSAVDYGGLLPVEPNGTATNPTLERPADGPLTEGMTFPAPSSYVTGDLRSGRALLRTVDGTPLLATASVENGRVLYYGYPPSDEAFAHNYRYPVFWKRVVYELTGRRPPAELNRRTGERLRFGANATVETPAGRREAGSLVLRRVGFYESGDRRYGASLASAAESNVTAPALAAGGGANDGSGGAAGSESRTVPLELTALAAGLAACVVLAELGFLRYRGDL